MTKLDEILAPPSRPKGISEDSKWLSGEGAGSWFSVKMLTHDTFVVSRFSPSGSLECDGLFKTSQKFNPKLSFDLYYPSHCKKVTIVQDNSIISLISSE